MAGGAFDPSAYGIDVTGGSSVSVPGYSTSSVNPTTKIYMGSGFNRDAFMGKATGTGKVYDPDRGSFVQQRGTSGPGQGPLNPDGDFTSYDEANMIPGSWTDAQKRDFISKGILYKLPGFNADMGMPEIMKEWGNLVDNAAILSRTGKDWSPWMVMESYANDDKGFGTIKKGDWLYDAATGEKIKYVGPKTKTTTDKRIDLSSAEDVKAITTQMLTELLGRAPTVEELAKYKTSINGYESSNPAVTTTTSHLDDQGEVTAQDSVTEGGATDAARSTLIQDAATKGPEYGKFQSGTTYFNALMQMLGG